MPNGYSKAVTFSFDDGVTQDQRLIAILDKYGLKCTFNLNSGLLGRHGSLIRGGVNVSHIRPTPGEIAGIYKNHEVAAHTLTHPTLTACNDEEIIRQVEEDRLTLSELVGYEVCGMAYPGGGVNYNDHVARIIRDHTGIQYARTTELTDCFSPQSDLYRFKPSAYILQKDEMLDTAKRFLISEHDQPQLLYIWGHSYEFDIDNSWDWFDDFCQMISNRSEVFYGTNREVWKDFLQ